MVPVRRISPAGWAGGQLLAGQGEVSRAA